MALVGKMGRWKAQVGGGGFDPLTDISWDVYFNASLIAGLADNDSVITWDDESGNANDATQGTAGLRGTYKTSILNGEPIVRFAADGYILTTPFYKTTGWTAFHVIKKSASGVGMPILASDSPLPYTLFPFADDNIYAINRTVGEFISDVATTFALYTTQNTSGDVLSIYKNGVLQSTSAINPADTADTIKYLGYRNADGASANGDMAHVSCATTLLATADREAMEDYLGALYGLTITH